MCPSNIGRRFPSPYTPYTLPQSAGNPPPHGRSVLLATDGQGHNSNGQGLLILPAGQGSQTRPPTTSRDTGTSPAFRPHPRQPGRVAAALMLPHLSFHDNRSDLEVAGVHPTLVHHRRRLRQSPLRGLVSRFEVPDTITSDRGAQFTSALWAGLCSLLNIQHSPMTAYHPQSNGLVEQFHRRLKEALWSRAAAADWQDHLPWVMLGIRASSGRTSSFLQRRLYSAHNWSCRANSSTAPSRPCRLCREGFIFLPCNN